MQAEYDALIKSNTWTLTDPPPRVKPLKGKWVFKTKFKSDGSVERHKCRYVIKGWLILIMWKHKINLPIFSPKLYLWIGLQDCEP